VLSACQKRAALILFDTRDARNDTKFRLSEDLELTLGSLLFSLMGLKRPIQTHTGSSFGGVKEPCTPLCPVSPHILAPPAQSSISFRAPPPSLGSPRLGSRASESRLTPVPGTDGPVPPCLPSARSRLDSDVAGMELTIQTICHPDLSGARGVRTAGAALEIFPVRRVGPAGLSYTKSCEKRDSATGRNSFSATFEEV